MNFELRENRILFSLPIAQGNFLKNIIPLAMRKCSLRSEKNKIIDWKDRERKKWTASKWRCRCCFENEKSQRRLINHVKSQNFVNNVHIWLHSMGCWPSVGNFIADQQVHGKTAWRASIDVRNDNITINRHTNVYAVFVISTTEGVHLAKSEGKNRTQGKKRSCIKHNDMKSAIMVIYWLLNALLVSIVNIWWLMTFVCVFFSLSLPSSLSRSFHIVSCARHFGRWNVHMCDLNSM